MLGPVEVRDGGRVLDIGPPQRRMVVAALVTDAGRPVSSETLIDRVWDDAPRAARQVLHTHVSRIRKMLAGAAEPGGTAARLVRRSGGYVLEVDPEDVDLYRFRGLVQRARTGAHTGAARAALLRAALDLWRGEPLAGLSGAWAARMREGWRQQRLEVAVPWAKAELETGDPTALASRLTELAGEYPLVESLTAELMRALHAAGQTAEALSRYATTRRRLVEELGAEPGVELRRVHQEILRGDPDLHSEPAALSVRPSRPDPSLWRPPAQLPGGLPGFTGRTDELTALDQTMVAINRRTAPVISVVSGTAGVGKTALAVHWAHRIRDEFPDGQLYVNLRGFSAAGTVMDPAQAVQRFLDAFEIPPQRVPADVQAQVALYRSLLANRRVLVVLDNARDADQVRPLLPGSPGCLTIVTSRNQLSSLIAVDGAHPLTLDLLTVAEAGELLARRLGADRVAAEPLAVDEIITRCSRLPLALTIVAARAAAHPRFSLTSLATELGATGGLDAFHREDPSADVRAVLSWSCQALSAGAARLLRLLSQHPGPDIATAAAASLAGTGPREIRLLLAELADAHLVTEHTVGRFAFHDLLRVYAGELADTTDSDAERAAAVHRGLDHYLHTAYRAALLLDSRRQPTITLCPPRPGVIPEHMADHEQALAWFAAEYRVLLAILDQAVRTGMHRHTWQTAWTLEDFFDRQGRWHDWVSTHRAAVEAAERLADPIGQAQAHRGLARASRWLDLDEEADFHLRRALDLFGAVDDSAGQARVHRGLARLMAVRGNYQESLVHDGRAFDLYLAAGDEAGQAHSLNNIGWTHALLGDHQRALAHCRRALARLTALGDRHGAAASWDSLGYAHHHSGDNHRAVACYRRAVALFREVGDRYDEAATLGRLGDAECASGDPASAQDAWRRALRLLEALGHLDAHLVRVKLGRLAPGR